MLKLRKTERKQGFDSVAQYDKNNYPIFVCHHGNWDIYSNDRGNCVSIPTSEAETNGCIASYFGDAGYVKATLGVTVKAPNDASTGALHTAK